MRSKLRAEDIMTRNPVTVQEEDNLLDVMEKLRERPYHHLPVVDGPKVVGMLSQRDMMRMTVTGNDHSAVGRAREARFLEGTFVRDVMNKPAYTTHGNTPIVAIAQRMLALRVGALAVIDDAGNLLGIVTENDLVRQIAQAES